MKNSGLGGGAHIRTTGSATADRTEANVTSNEGIPDGWLNQSLDCRSSKERRPAKPALRARQGPAGRGGLRCELAPQAAVDVACLYDALAGYSSN